MGESAIYTTLKRKEKGEKKIMKGMLPKILAMTLILSLIAAIPSAAAVQCCPRATWEKPARNFMDNYAKCVFDTVSVLLGAGHLTPAEQEAYWLALREDADDAAVAGGTNVTVTLLQNIIIAFIQAALEGPPTYYNATYALYVATGAVHAAEGACLWPPNPAPTTYLEVSQKDYCFFPAKPVSTYFNVSVIVQDVTDMKGCAIKLGYNATLISAIRVYPTAITATTTDWLPVDSHGVFHFDADPTINNTRLYLYNSVYNYSYVWVSAWGFSPFNGTGAVFNILFHINMMPPVETVGAPENRCYCCILDLWDTEVLNSMSSPITHAPLDGCYCNIQPMHVVGTPTAVCNVYPSTQYVGNNVTFDGSASSSGDATPLQYMWDVGSDGTFDIITNSTKASWRCDAEGHYNVTLKVMNIIGKTSTAAPQYWDCIKPLGTIQDLYTSPNRFCGQITPFIGTGLAGDPSILDPLLNPGYVDALTPDVNITLYTKITFNGQPRMHVLVAFAILYEWKLVDQSKGFPAGYVAVNQTIDVRTAETDKDGIAVTWFRVPMWCTGLPFGKWLVTATCKVQEKKTLDWIRFDVGYPVWLEKVTTFDPATKLAKDKFKLYDTIGITVSAKNIMFIPKPVLFVCTVYDTCDVPIAMCYINMTAPPAVIYCHPTYFTHNCTVVIPQWTYVGIGKVIVGAYTDWPYKLGEAYCPEVSTQVTITSP
jgi:hypothetical protein